MRLQNSKILTSLSNLLQDFWDYDMASPLQTLVFYRQNLSKWREVLKDDQYLDIKGFPFTALDCFEDKGNKLIFYHECGYLIIDGK